MRRKNAGYKFTEYPNGFRISARRRVPVEVRLVEYGLQSKDEYSLHFRRGLYEMNRLIYICAEQLMANWTPPINKRKYFIRVEQKRVYLGKKPSNLNPFDRDPRISFKIPKIEFGYHAKWFRIKTWAKTQCRKAIAKRIKEQVERLRRNVPDEVLRVQRNAFAATLECQKELMTKEFYDQLDEYTIRDLGRYRAAAIIASKLTEEHLYEGLKNWRECLSYNGETYHALNVTLDNFPGGIPHGLPTKLRSIKLVRPITDRIELIALCTFIEKENDRHALPHRHIFLHARRDEILRAVDHYKGSKVGRRGSRELMHFLSDMMDYPHPHNGRILGLAKKSRVWHRQTNRDDILTRHELSLEDPVQIPPIDLPQDEGVKFLATVGDIITEGEEMGHCVGSYAPRAKDGYCYIFHVSKNGDDATVEVSVFNNSVSQVRGPHNSNNGACRHAEKVLAKWALGLPKVENANQFIPF